MLNKIKWYNPQEVNYFIANDMVKVGGNKRLYTPLGDNGQNTLSNKE